MAAADDDFAFLLKAIERLLSSIRSEVESGQSYRHRGDVLARHVIQTLDAITRRVREEQQRYPQRTRQSSKEIAADSLRLYMQLVWVTHSATCWLAQDEDTLDLGAIYFADEAALAMLGQGAEIVPVADSEYMYSTVSWPFAWLFEGYLEAEMPKGPRPIVLIYPDHERHNTLLHCLFAHELGHATVHKYDLASKVLRKLNTTREYRQVIEKLIPPGEDQADPEVVGEIEEQALSWLEEMLCDACAFGYLGPSYLFAFAEFCLSTSWAEVGEEHPSTTLRTDLLLRFAKRTGWDSYLKGRVSQIWSWFEFAASSNSSAADPVSLSADQICLLAHNLVIEAAEEILGDKLFRSNGWRRQDRHFSKLLDNDILPVTQRDETPASHAEIMLATWLQAIDKHGGGPAALASALGEERYPRFVAKALEMTTVLRTWKEVDLDATAA
jgi:hypothetical protein